MAFNSNDDLRFAPAYSISEAARYLHMPPGTLRSWIVGRRYPISGGSKRSRPLIHLTKADEQFLSFINLVEAHVLAAICRKYGVKIPKIRTALDYLDKKFSVDHPLIKQSFQTDGLDLFVDRYGDLINVSREGQSAMKEIIGVYLQRIEWDSRGLPIKLYPFTRETQSENPPLSSPRVIVMNPAVSFGRPIVAGTGIPVASIYERYKAGDSIKELAQDFRLEVSSIEEAIRCEAA
ncbi:MAG: DUF433 domain-containing protein [Acidobacteriota bacterium]|nr:DUF433 domain-containing protein [Acidobacteriota bacterium]